MVDFNQQETIKRVEKWCNAHLDAHSDLPEKEKVFYHYTEWCGWRFYKKAIQHKDWGSVKYKLKSHFR